MKTEQRAVQLRPISQIDYRGVLSKRSVIGQPNPDGELAICVQYQELILQKILPTIGEVRDEDKAINREGP